MKWLVLAAAGALGTVSRFAMASWVQRVAGTSFPWGVTAVNLAGSLLFGVIFGLVGLRLVAHPQLQAFWLVGFLGAFTTFSTLMFDTVRLIQGGHLLTAVGLLALQNGLGLLFFWAGFASTTWMGGKFFQ